MSLIHLQHSSLAQGEGDLGTKVTELMAVIDTMMAKVQSAEWEAQDQGAYMELQEMWNSDDESLRTVLEEIKQQVGATNEDYRTTVARNAALF